MVNCNDTTKYILQVYKESLVTIASIFAVWNLALSKWSESGQISFIFWMERSKLSDGDELPVQLQVVQLSSNHEECVLLSIVQDPMQENSKQRYLRSIISIQITSSLQMQFP